ncbi:ABC transporter permease subunit [Haloglycomyces albus]|uniref:ABC transporter permease subunit n=1 Tax=Haloglycomyces albus TaxID=526067 RepID=UPI0004B232F2|nr:ABC transporter permease subunit [Haloglycomyces albus]
MAQTARASTTVSGALLKIAALGLATALAVWAALPLISKQAWGWLIVEAAVVAIVYYVYLQRRFIPLKYLVPGTLLLLFFQIVPVIMTATTAVTNYGDGHRLDKDGAIDATIAAGLQRDPDSPTYLYAVGESSEGDLALLLTNTADDSRWVGDNEGLDSLPDSETDVDAEGRITDAEGYRIWPKTEVNERIDEVEAIAVPTDDGGGINVQGFTAFEGTSSRSYDAECDCITDSATGEVWTANNDRGAFYNEDGQRALAGWKVNVGLDNFTKVFTDPDIRNPFARVFLWNVGFAAGSVLLTFMLGLACAMALNKPDMKGTKLYRTIMILPYAMPAFGMFMVWEQMFNNEYGLINNALGWDVNWLSGVWTARFMVLFINLWLGFPYMFLISLGALQALPSDTLEAARIDGASGFRAFRSITLPLLLVSLTPLLISAFAFNFNNINAIILTTGGHPLRVGDEVGGTDLLISYTYRMAFEGVNPDYGFAAAISIFIFLIVATMSAAMFRFTAKQEEVFQ